MNKIIFLSALLMTHQVVAEFYSGVGFGWNTIDETFDSTLVTSEDKGGRDRYEVNVSRFAPVVQLGYRFPFCDDWEVGLLAEWKFLNYKTPNVNSSRGQILPNATFSSINIFGPDVTRDFTSKTRVNNEWKLLGYFGMQVCSGHAYLGLGPVLFAASNSVYNSSVHIPNGTGNHLISTSVTSDKVVWGGAVQVGYQYSLHSNFFLSISYSYSQTGKNQFDNSVNAAQFNGVDLPGPTELFLSRSITFAVQELVLSLDLAF